MSPFRSPEAAALFSREAARYWLLKAVGIAVAIVLNHAVLGGSIVVDAVVVVLIPLTAIGDVRRMRRRLERRGIGADP